VNRAVDYYNELARTWEDRYDRRSFKRREQLVLAFVMDQPLPSQHWIDAGCGTGRLSRLLAGHGANVVGVDAAEEMLAMGRALADRLLVGARLSFQHIEDVNHLPFAASSFAGALCISVLEYLDDPLGCLREFARVVRSGGTLVVSVPNSRSILRRAQSIEFRLTRLLGRAGSPAYMRYSKNAFAPSDFARILVQSGFTPTRCEYFGVPWPTFAQNWPGLGSLILFKATRA
jgi:ubiquinone/menaquinone biosynthesis C-methylase UbiE